MKNKIDGVCEVSKSGQTEKNQNLKIRVRPSIPDPKVFKEINIPSISQDMYTGSDHPHSFCV